IPPAPAPLIASKAPAAPLAGAGGALPPARDESPGRDVEPSPPETDGRARGPRRYLRGSLEARVAGLSRYLFHEMGFRGNTGDYYDARNSYLNEVLDRRTGIPITLSAVAMAVGRRAGLGGGGGGLAGHFGAKGVGGPGEGP